MTEWGEAASQQRVLSSSLPGEGLLMLPCLLLGEHRRQMLEGVVSQEAMASEEQVGRHQQQQAWRPEQPQNQGLPFSQ